MVAVGPEKTAILGLAAGGIVSSPLPIASV